MNKILGWDANEMRTFANNVMEKPDSLSCFIEKSSDYFTFDFLLKYNNLDDIIQEIKLFKNCNYTFFSMCKKEIHNPQTKTIHYGTTIVYSSNCNDFTVQFMWVLIKDKWELSKIAFRDFTACFPKDFKKRKE